MKKLMKKLLSLSVLALTIVVLFSLTGVPAEAASAPALSASKATVYVGETKKLTVKNTTSTVTWSTSNSKVATVSKKGVVTGKKAGTATITAKVGSKKLKCTITVKNQTINKTKATIYALDTLQLKITKTSQKITWSSSNKAVATVTSKGLVKAKKGGSATITAKFGTKKLTCKVTVKNLSLNYKKAELLTGETLQLKVMKTANEITWSSTDKATAYVTKKGKIQAKKAGTATVSAKVTSAVGTKTLKCTVTITDPKTDSEAELLPDATAFTEKEAAVFEESVLDITAKDVETDYGTSKNFDISIDGNSAFAARIDSETVKPGDVIILPPDETYLTGFTFIIDSIDRKTDKFIIHARQPEFTELFGDEGEISYTGGADPEDPLAFVISADGTTLTGDMLSAALSGEDVYSNGLLISGAQDTYTRNLFPEGIPIVPSIQVNSNGTFNVEVNLKDVILYDEDKSGVSTEDQILIDAGLSYKNIRFNGRTAWDTGLPEQISFGMSYDKTEEIRLKMTKGFKLSDVIKKVSGFDNTARLPYSEITGVNLDGRLFLGSFGIRGGKPFLAKGLDGVVSVDPVFFVSVYLDLDGSVSGEGSFGMLYESYVEEGFSLYDTTARNVINDYDFDKLEAIDNTNYAHGTWSRETVSRSDNSEPQWKGSYTFNGKVNGEIGIGLMAGVSVANIIPGDVYAEAVGSVSGAVRGSIYNLTRYSAEEGIFDCDGKAALDCKTSVNLGAECSLTMRFFGAFGLLYKLPMGFSVSAEKQFLIDSYNVEYPGAVMTGNIYDCDLAQSDLHYTVPDTEVCIYRQDLLEADGIEKVTDEKTGKKTWPVHDLLFRMEDYHATSEDGGAYLVEHLPKGKYVLLLRKTDYHPYVKEFEVIDDGEGFAADITADYYIYQYNWLDECSPLRFDNKGGNAGTGKLFDGSDENASMRISGVNYGAGFYLDSGNQGQGGTCDAIWQLDGKYDSLDVRIGLLDKTSPLFADLNIYLADTEEGLYAEGIEPSQTIKLTPYDVSRIYTINFYGYAYARFALAKTTWNNWAYAQYGFVEGVWHPAGDYSPTYNTYWTKDPFEVTDFGDPNFLAVCPIFRVVDSDVYPNNGKTFTWLANGQEWDTGFVMKSHSVSTYGNAKVLFNTGGRFSSLTLDVGYVKHLKDSQFHVYLDGATEPSQSFDLTKDSISTVTIDVNYADCVMLQIDNHNDNWATDAIGFANGWWSW